MLVPDTSEEEIKDLNDFQEAIDILEEALDLDVLDDDNLQFRARALIQRSNKI